MPTSPLNEIKEKLKVEIEQSFELIGSINQLAQNLQNDQVYLIQIDQVYLIYELSFLKIFLAWEYFLEKSFILYMLGKKTENGYKPESYVTPIDEDHAYKIIKGGANFPNWLDLEFIREKSELFFKDGEPFKSALYDDQTIHKGLRIMKTTRNRIVHVSPGSREKFESMLRDEFGYATDITPGEFLMKEGKKTKKSYINYFKEILLISAERIVR